MNRSTAFLSADRYPADAESRRGPAGLRWAIGVVSLAIWLTACARRDPPAPPVAVVPVIVTNAIARDVPEQLSAIGGVQPFSTVTVKSQVQGVLKQVGFTQGDEVHEGDLIFLIDPRPFEAARDQTVANLARDRALLAKAEADFRRDSELLTNRIISRAEFDQDLANVDSLKATLIADQAAITNAEVQLSFCYLRAPITGRIGTLLVNEGNVVKSADTVLAVINQIQPIYVDFSVPEQHLPIIRDRMKSGTLAVDASIPGYADRRATGRLLLVNNQVDATGTVLLRAEFTNSDEMLWPGQFVNAALTLRVQRQAVLVPSSAIQLSQDGRYACVVKPDDTVEFRAVELGNVVGTMTVVRKGLQAGERIVTSGQLRLSPGAKVKVISREAEAPARPRST